MDLTYEEMVEIEKLMKDNKELAPFISDADYWINGKRSIAEIAHILEILYGKMNLSLLIKYMKNYEKHGMIKLKKK
jgi:hypothetical protein